ncbi:MAG: sigma-70 family RNA polymerase sigma factor, partial [Chitinophagales bacterium]
QETFARWLNQDHSKIENNKAYLVQSLKNACLNYLEELKRKRNEKLNEWSDQFSEYQQNLELLYHDMEKEMSMRLADMMQKLNPKEQAIYVLRNSFDMSYEEITELIDTKMDNARKTFQRAKERMQEKKTRFELNKETYRNTLPNFLNAYQKGQLNDYLDSIRAQLPDFFKS